MRARHSAGRCCCKKSTGFARIRALTAYVAAATGCPFGDIELFSSGGSSLGEYDFSVATPGELLNATIRVPMSGTGTTNTRWVVSLPRCETFDTGAVMFLRNAAAGGGQSIKIGRAAQFIQDGFGRNVDLIVPAATGFGVFPSGLDYPQTAPLYVVDPVFGDVAVSPSSEGAWRSAGIPVIIEELTIPGDPGSAVNTPCTLVYSVDFQRLDGVTFAAVAANARANDDNRLLGSLITNTLGFGAPSPTWWQPDTGGVVTATCGARNVSQPWFPRGTLGSVTLALRE